MCSFLVSFGSSKICSGCSSRLRFIGARDGPDDTSQPRFHLRHLGSCNAWVFSTGILICPTRRNRSSDDMRSFTHLIVSRSQRDRSYAHHDVLTYNFTGEDRMCVTTAMSSTRTSSKASPPRYTTTVGTNSRMHDTDIFGLSITWSIVQATRRFFFFFCGCFSRKCAWRKPRYHFDVDTIHLHAYDRD